MIYKKMFLSFFKDKKFRGTIEIRHKGKIYSFGKGKKVNINIIRDAFFRRIILYGEIGLGEGFFMGDFETDDLRELLLWFVNNRDQLPGFPTSKVPFYTFEWAKMLSKTAHFLRKNTRRGSRKNIKRHYDLSNRFYSLWLDDTMTYSCAVFEKGMTLAQAQENKYKKICEKLSLKKDDRVLEMGTGWGGFSIYAAKNYGCRVTTVTISRKQYGYAKQRISKSGLDNIDLRFKDYRDLKGTYDKIVSIEMMEALGHKYVPVFIRKCDSLLKKGGRMCYQCITFPDADYRLYLKSQDYIKKHIFPGAELLSVAQIKKEAKKNSLKVKDVEYIGRHYATTLNHWEKNFIRRKEEIMALGFDERFFLKWLYYFIYCGVGFETGYINDAQVLIVK